MAWSFCTPDFLPTRRQNRCIMTPAADQSCDKTALLFLENTKFDILKEDSAKEASSFKLLVHADNGENWPA